MEYEFELQIDISWSTLNYNTWLRLLGKTPTTALTFAPVYEFELQIDIFWSTLNYRTWLRLLVKTPTTALKNVLWILLIQNLKSVYKQNKVYATLKNEETIYVRYCGDWFV